MSNFPVNTCVIANDKYFDDPHWYPNAEKDIRGQIGIVTDNHSLYIKVRFGDSIYLFEPDELEVADHVLSPGFRH